MTDTTLRTLDLGCGPSPRSLDGALAYGVDVSGYLPAAAGITPAPGVYWCDLAQGPLPFPDDFFVRVFAHDVLEHVPAVLYDQDNWRPDGAGAMRLGLRRRHCHVELFNEVWRVLRPGCVFEVEVPVLSPLNLAAAVGDPTHCSLWTANSFNYFCCGPDNFEYAWMRRYGYRAAFQRLSERHVHGGGHLRVEMRAVKG